MSGNNELNQLQQQRQDLIEERERLEADLPRLENALEQAPHWLAPGQHGRQ